MRRIAISSPPRRLRRLRNWRRDPVPVEPLIVLGQAGTEHRPNPHAPRSCRPPTQALRSQPGRRLSVSSRSTRLRALAHLVRGCSTGRRAACARTYRVRKQMTLLRSDLQFSAPDDVYEAIISLGNGLDERTAHTALAAFALLLANHIGDDKIIHEAIAAVRQAAQGVSGSAEAWGARSGPQAIPGRRRARFAAQNHRGEAGADHSGRTDELNTDDEQDHGRRSCSRRTGDARCMTVAVRFRARARLRSRIGTGHAGDIALQSLVAAAASDVADRRP